MATSQQIFRAWLRDRVAPALRECDFQGSGQDYHRRYDSNWAAINFQRDRYSSAAQLRFTINLGTASAAVLAADRRPVDSPVPEVQCHWRQRIGVLLPGRRDTWWAIHEDERPEKLESLTAEVVPGLVERAVPHLEKMATDEAILAASLTSWPLDKLPPAFQDICGPILQKVGPPQRFAEYMSLLDATEPDLTAYEIYAQFPPRMGEARTARALEKLKSRSFEPRSLALMQLAFASPTPEVVGAVHGALDDADPNIRFAAAFAAGRVGGEHEVGRLAEIIEHDPRWSACSAAVAAWRLAPRVGEQSRAVLARAMTARHADAVGHERPLLAYLTRQIEAMPK